MIWRVICVDAPVTTKSYVPFKWPPIGVGMEEAVRTVGDRSLVLWFKLIDATELNFCHVNTYSYEHKSHDRNQTVQSDRYSTHSA